MMAMMTMRITTFTSTSLPQHLRPTHSLPSLPLQHPILHTGSSQQPPPQHILPRQRKRHIIQTLYEFQGQNVKKDVDYGISLDNGDEKVEEKEVAHYEAKKTGKDEAKMG
jgi:hypothetical protein